MLLVIENGTRRAFGPKDEVLAEMVKNHGEIKRDTGKAGGVS
jgi:ABC-type protease/lipase transport system fused ATPase/permease subunit